MQSNWVPKRIDNADLPADEAGSQNPPAGGEEETPKIKKNGVYEFMDSIRVMPKGTKVLVVVGVFILAAGFWYGSQTLKFWDGFSSEGELLSENHESPDEAGLKTYESPINGILYAKEAFEKLLNKKPLAVLINNHTEARPQNGISRADVIYEIVAEGGITRLLGIFHSKEVNDLGSIRSIRAYYAMIAAEYDPWLVHAGGSSSDVPEADGYGFVRKNGIPQIDHVTGWGSDAFRRVKEKTAPHNLYVSTQKARQEAEKLYAGWPLVPILPGGWDFKDDNETNSSIGVDKEAVDIEFWETPGYSVEWKYNKESNAYLRSQGGEPHMDEITNTQLNAKNVVIQYAVETPANDGKGHLIYDLIGSGKAKYYLDGKEYEGTWVKTELRKRTKFYLGNGDDVKFNRGQIWVEIVPDRNF